VYTWIRSSAGRSRKLRLGVETANLENKDERSLITVASTASLRSLSWTAEGGFGSASRCPDMAVARVRNAVDNVVLCVLWGKRMLGSVETKEYAKTQATGTVWLVRATLLLVITIRTSYIDLGPGSLLFDYTNP
jgi:hypothetical protein